MAAGTLSIANAGDRELSGTVTVVPSEGESKALPVEVGPRSRTRVALRDVVAAPYAAALVELEWFINEQVEEEKTARDIVYKFQLVKDDPAALLDMDRELGARGPEAENATE